MRMSVNNSVINTRLLFGVKTTTRLFLNLLTSKKGYCCPLNKVMWKILDSLHNSEVEAFWFYSTYITFRLRPRWRRMLLESRIIIVKMSFRSCTNLYLLSYRSWPVRNKNRTSIRNLLFSVMKINVLKTQWVFTLDVTYVKIYTPNIKKQEKNMLFYRILLENIGGGKRGQLITTNEIFSLLFERLRRCRCVAS